MVGDRPGDGGDRTDTESPPHRAAPDHLHPIGIIHIVARDVPEHRFALALAPPVLPNESAMLADPVDGLLSGLRSGVARTIIALLAIFVGFAICYLSVKWEIEVLWAWVGLGLGLIFWWGTFGGWFFVGLASFVLMLAFLWSFTQERVPKFSLFAIFSFSVVYFMPLAFDAQQWIWTLCFYLGAAFCYWVLPGLIDRFAARLAQRS